MSRTHPATRHCPSAATSLGTLLATFLAFAQAACLFVAAPALALPITYQVESGIGFSRIDATDKTGYLGDLHGEITLDYQAGTDTFSFLSSTVWLDSKEYLFEITGGLIHGDGAGSLDFDLVGLPEFAQTSSFFFQGGDPVCCGPDGPNYANTGEIKLYGSSPGTLGGASPVNINMTATSTSASPMPEPSAALTFAAGALLVSGAVRRRSR